MKLVTNLDGPFLCPFQILIDLSQQLEFIPKDLNKLAFAPICELNTTNDWINVEALGNPGAIRAQALSNRVSEACKKNAIDRLELHLYLPDATLTLDNLFLLYFLNQALSAFEVCFYVKSENLITMEQMLENSPLKQDRKILIKTIESFLADSSLQEKLINLATQRQLTLESNGFPLSKLFNHSSPLNSGSIGLLIGYSWMCLKAGAYEIGCETLSKFCDQTTLPQPDYELIFMHLQLIRFLSHQYHLVTETPFPQVFQTLSQKDVMNLYFIKAYAATLSRNLVVAGDYFDKCHINQDMPISDESSLYQLNLYALFLVLKGEIGISLSLEIKIKDYISKHGIDVLGLKYVNFINLARIHKKLDQVNQSLEYYDRAYEQLRGGFTTSDHIYYNMNLGSIHEAAGQFEKALHYWIKAAIYWITNDNPFALSWRPRLILCQEKMIDILRPLKPERANEFLRNKLNTLALLAQIKLSAHPCDTFGFSCDDIKTMQKINACYISENIVLFSSQITAPHSIGHDDEALRNLVSQLIRTILGIEDAPLTFIIPTDYDDFYPKTSDECLALALLTGCETFHFNGELIKFDTNKIQESISMPKVKLCKAIQSIHFSEVGVQLIYKRSFLDKEIVLAEEVNLIKQLFNEKVLDLKFFAASFPQVLANLIKQKVIMLDQDERAMAPTLA